MPRAEYLEVGFGSLTPTGSTLDTYLTLRCNQLKSDTGILRNFNCLNEPKALHA